jgi:hypothetical protein
VADKKEQTLDRRGFLTGLARTGLVTGLAALAYALLRRPAAVDRDFFERCRDCRLYAQCTVPTDQVSTCNERVVTD